MERRLKRGEVWTAAGGPAYAGKPRPVVVVQDDRFDATASVTICPLTTDRPDVPLLRVAIEPTELNGLRERARLMIDKITTIPKTKMGRRLGRLSEEDVTRLNRSVVVFLGLAGSGGGV